MIRFNNDYNQMAHEEVLRALEGIRTESYAGYGEDEWCMAAAERIRHVAECPSAGVFFVPGATQANFIVCKAALSPIQSIICADTGHINAHEAASIETTGHKILALPNKDGRITAEQVYETASAYFDKGEQEYLTEPHLVYISFATEWGTIYSLSELEAISEVCRRYGMLLFVDGARLGYGLGAEGCDVQLSDFARLADVFYIGGTKCGAMFGEALVIPSAGLKKKFRTYMKQSGAVLAKGWLMGLQFYTLFEDELYLRITRRADEYAMLLRDAFRRKGIPEYIVSPTNQQFVVLTDEQKHILADDFTFEDEGSCVRFCTSWGTTREDIDTLIEAIENL